VKLLIGNKSDLEEKVSIEEGEEKANRLKINFIETSAKNSENVDMAFSMMAADLIKIREEYGMPNTANPQPGLVLAPPASESKSSSSCC
jgi:Ras-related protein Rab-1A